MIKRFYLMPKVWRTVTDSQVFNWVRIVNDNGVSTDCISFSKTKEDSVSISNIEKKIGGNFIQYNIYSPILNDFYVFVKLLKHYFQSFGKYKVIIFQTRMPNLGIPLRLISLFPKSRIVFESRGATIEERIFEGLGLQKNIKKKIRASLFYFSEKMLVKKANKVICVSHALKNYYMKKFALKDGESFFVTPGAADGHMFQYNNELRVSARNQLNFKENDIVIVYSGALIMKWEIPEVLFNYLSTLSKMNDNFKFLIITPDADIANHHIEVNGLELKSVVKCVTFDKVNELLNASDIGLLLRDDILMNNVSSPTKFSEYLLTGLPVIISLGVYDFAKIVKDTGFGIVVKNNTQVNKSDLKKIMDLRELNRMEVSNWGINNLSKERFIKDYIAMLISL